MMITAEDYICYQVNKHMNKQTDPQSYSNKVTHNNNNDSQNIHDDQQAKKTSIRRCTGIHTKTLNDTRVDKNSIQKGENIVKTRYGTMIRKPDRLTYQ